MDSVTEVRFRAMGTDCHVLVTGPVGAELTEQAQRRVEQLEARWSRFLPDSEINRINRMNGAAAAGEVTVSVDTVALLERALVGWQSTKGLWNPFLGTVLHDLGYDRSFDRGLVGAQVATAAVHTTCETLTSPPLRIVDSCTIEMDPGITIDVGGIAKGFAADKVSAELLAAGAWGSVVNLGGDVRVRGLPPAGIDWVIDVGEPAVGVPRLTTVRLPSGGVCTSTTARRRWQSPDGERHHLIDPRTSLPAAEQAVLTTVVAGAAWWAEVAATALTINPELALPNCSALQLQADGTAVRRNNFERYEDS